MYIPDRNLPEVATEEIFPRLNSAINFIIIIGDMRKLIKGTRKQMNYGTDFSYGIERQSPLEVDVEGALEPQRKHRGKTVTSITRMIYRTQAPVRTRLSYVQYTRVSCIRYLNSEKSTRWSPFRSTLQIIVRQSSSVRTSPRSDKTLCNSAAEMKPSLLISKTSNAAAIVFCSSSIAPASLY